MTVLCQSYMCGHPKDRHVEGGGAHPCRDCLYCRGWLAPVTVQEVPAEEAPDPRAGGATRPRPGYTFLHTRKCRGCPALVYWWETVNGKPSPHDRDGTSHFATCPAQASFRKPRGGDAP